MDTNQSYPGTMAQQALLRAIVAYYEGDPRILAVAVFGSLGRGNWDEYSDLDLDIVLAPGVQLDVTAELHGLCRALEVAGERAVLIVPDGDDAGDVVLASLHEFSIRYHLLETTSPNIVDSLRLLTGRIDAEVIRAAGLANRRMCRPLAQGLAAYVRWALGVDVALQRGRFWQALPLLERMRAFLLEAFAVSHGSVRSYHAFEAQAGAALQERIGATLPGYSLRSAQECLLRMLDIAEQDLALWGDGQLLLSAGQREISAAIRRRQAMLQLAG